MNSQHKSQLLKEALAEWHSAELSAYKVACALGICPPEDGSFEGYRDAKALFNSASELGDAIGRFIDDLTKAGVLELDSKSFKYRWNPKFKGFWE